MPKFPAGKVERKQIEVTIPGEDDRYGVIKVTTSLPPHKPELRLTISPFERMGKKRNLFGKNSFSSSFILTTKEGVKLLSSVLRKTADMIEGSSERLPSKKNIV
jgi:hypothetical protein